jgi:putrescine aminotransferase
LAGKPEKQIIIAREFSYHGSTLASASLSGMPPMHAQAAALPGFAHIPTAYQFKEGRGLSEEEYALKAAHFLEEKIREIGSEKVAAFVAEPVHGAGGGQMPPGNYWGEIQRICKKYDVLLVVDEVVTGFGRTGNWFGSETFGIEGIDLMPMAKGITSGYVPLGAVMVGDRIAETLIDRGGEFYHGFTYSGHPVSCAVALENLAVMEEKNLVQKVAKETGPYLSERMQQALAGHPMVGAVRTCGLIGAMELVRDKETLAPLEPAGEVGELYKPLAMAHGVITRPVGETVLVMPPLIIDNQEIDFLVDQMALALDDFREQILSRENRKSV